MLKPVFSPGDLNDRQMQPLQTLHDGFVTVASRFVGEFPSSPSATDNFSP